MPGNGQGLQPAAHRCRRICNTTSLSIRCSLPRPPKLRCYSHVLGSFYSRCGNKTCCYLSFMCCPTETGLLVLSWVLCVSYWGCLWSEVPQDVASRVECCHPGRPYFGTRQPTYRACGFGLLVKKQKDLCQTAAPFCL